MLAHEYANLFPMATESELADMVKDIAEHGLMNPIITYEGKILDGRNRYKACELAGIKHEFKPYEGKDPLGYVLSLNLHRRHLTPSQCATVAMAVEPLYAALAKERMLAGKADDPMANLPQGSIGTARDQAANAVGVSGRLVQDAKFVQEHAPELFEKVKAGEITVNKAKKEIKAKERWNSGAAVGRRLE